MLEVWQQGAETLWKDRSKQKRISKNNIKMPRLLIFYNICSEKLWIFRSNQPVMCFSKRYARFSKPIIWEDMLHVIIRMLNFNYKCREKFSRNAYWCILRPYLVIHWDVYKIHTILRTTKSLKKSCYPPIFPQKVALFKKRILSPVLTERMQRVTFWLNVQIFEVFRCFLCEYERCTNIT